MSGGFGIHRALGEYFLHQCAKVWVRDARKVIALLSNNVYVSVECFLVKNWWDRGTLDRYVVEA